MWFRGEEMVKVEVFSSPGCGKCAHAKNILEGIVREMGRHKIFWREVNIQDEKSYADGLGVMVPPAIAINGELAFDSVPNPAKLRTELARLLS